VLFFVFGGLSGAAGNHAGAAAFRRRLTQKKAPAVNQIIYLVGLVVIVVAIVQFVL